MLSFISNAIAAGAVRGKSAVATAAADPLAALLKKSLLVFIEISSLSVVGSVSPEIVRQIYNDRLWCTSHHYPSKWILSRRVELLMWQPTRHMQKVARSNGDRVLPEVAPAHVSLSLKHVNDSVLFAVVVDACLSGRLHHKYACPKRRLNAIHCRNSRHP